ncbi:hypothetical protein [Gandjariella thermophila]|uniref:Gram-positive cocci surface proteins LPxTG domain-containing protein n=1 Tax=Gandjariella thermophila TaxID=1931992 RepID=A0A4D4IYW1_9PSEU|nr:hypothetical protein [Gandjariella thermophila]GDY29535.1 hypothetical protein GTS_11680 [Gandjariella thermophila]
MVGSSLSAGVRRVLLAAPLALLTVLGAAAAAHATPSTPPQSGDVRAVAKPGNVHDGECAGAGLPGQAVDVEANIDGNTYITITGVPDGVTLTGVVVKGSPAYNVYTGLTDWSRLHAPLAGKSGQPATISHWFACGTGTKSSTPKPPSTSKPPASGSSTARSSTPAGGAAATGRTTTSASAVAAASENGRLANTGFDSALPLGLAAALLLGGGTALTLARRRAARRRG